MIARPLRAFLETEASGGIVLLCAAAVALAWVNSPFAASYEALWSTQVRLVVGGFELAEDLRHWVNEALMAIFFFVVGLEIKRELVVGELNDKRKAALPVVAALGGMAIPALLYLAVNVGGEGMRGWGIPMATDIAFAVGVLALAGDRVPSGLKVFLLSLAIVDDIGAILVIAIFYASAVQLWWLAVACAGIVASLVLQRMRVGWMPLYVAIGVGVWLATFESGVHATIAGVALGLTTPAHPSDPGGFSDVVERAGELSREPDARSLRDISIQADQTVSSAERIGYALHPWSSFVIVPLFALANAGIEVSGAALREAISSPVTLGIVLGLVVGKVIGIAGAAWVATRVGFARLPDAVTMRDVVGAGALGGIGFTVSLFIATLAFDDQELVAVAKIGILAGSAVAACVGATLLLGTSEAPTREDR